MIPLATVTVIRGDGDCRTIVNGLVEQEHDRQIADMQKEVLRLRQELNSKTQALSRLRARRLQDLTKEMHAPLKLRHKISYVFCVPATYVMDLVYDIADEIRETRRRREELLVPGNEEWAVYEGWQTPAHRDER